MCGGCRVGFDVSVSWSLVFFFSCFGVWWCGATSEHVPQANGCGPAGLKMDFDLEGAEQCCNEHDKVR